MDGCCRRCGRVAEKFHGEFLCEECRTGKPKFDRVASALYFDAEAREIVNAFKFKRHLWMRDDLADWLEAVVRTRFRIGEIDLIMPMPSTVWRRFDRGYNQCAYIARTLAKRLDRPYDGRVMRRAGSPRRQGGLNEAERMTNVIGTFFVRKPFAVAGRTVMVVDDIMTTGSTLSECAKELKLAGAKRVWCATLAHTLQKG